MLSRRAADCLTARVFDSSTVHGGCRLDAYREGDTYFIDINLPGIDPATVDVTVDRTVLTVRAERRHAGDGTWHGGDDHAKKADGLHLVGAEQPRSSVTRKVVLPGTMDTDRLDAAYDDGVLTLRIPLAAQDEPRPVEITADLAPAA